MMLASAVNLESSDAGELAPPEPARRALTRWNVEEELINSLSHGLGLVLSVGGLCGLVLLTRVGGGGDLVQVVGCSVFGIALVTLYAASTLYHTVRHPRTKAILRLIDHMSIYLLIAGTYTPFTLVSLRGVPGWTLFVLVWTLAVSGIVFKLVFGHRWPLASLGFYLAMGWVGVLCSKQVLATLPAGAIGLLLAGGLAYTAGTIFYARDHRRFFHAIWHVFVLAGSGLHYCAVALYVAPIVG
jgi:hemolysin III